MQLLEQPICFYNIHFLILSRGFNCLRYYQVFYEILKWFLVFLQIQAYSIEDSLWLQVQIIVIQMLLWLRQVLSNSKALHNMIKVFEDNKVVHELVSEYGFEWSFLIKCESLVADYAEHLYKVIEHYDF